MYGPEERSFDFLYILTLERDSVRDLLCPERNGGCGGVTPAAEAVVSSSRTGRTEKSLNVGTWKEENLFPGK